MAATAEESLPQRWLLVSPESLVLSASFTCDSIHVVLGVLGRKDSRHPAVEQISHVRVLGAGAAVFAHASNDTLGRRPKSSACMWTVRTGRYEVVVIGASATD